MTERPVDLLPELLLVLGSVTTLLLGSFLPRTRQGLARAMSAAWLLAALGTGISQHLQSGATVVYAGSFAVDGPTAVARTVVPLAALLVLWLSADETKGWLRESEFCVLVLLSTLGSQVLAGASDLSLLAMAYLLASVPLYALLGLTRTGPGTEAALKAYLLGAFAGVALLLGVTLLYGAAGATSYAALAERLPGAPVAVVATGLTGVLAALMFKAGAVPAHFWVPDASEGSGASVAALVTTLPKVGGLLAAYRLLTAVPVEVVDWPVLIAVLAAVTMTLGNLAAYTQEHPRRLLGWSTVSQSGYLLMAVAVAGRTALGLHALGFYLAAYALTNLGAFAVTAALPQHDRLEHYRGLASRQPWLAGALVVTLLGLVGTPPTAGFVGKLSVFASAWDGGFAWLVVVAAVNTVASLYYYLRWLAPVFNRAGSAGRPAVTATPFARTAAVTAAGGTLLLGTLSGLVLDRGLPLLR